MGNFKITFIVFGLWIGLLSAGSAVMELYLENQIYSYRTISVIAILFFSAVVSSALSWRFFTRFGSSVLGTSLFLFLGNALLFCLLGSVASYLVLVVPHLFNPGDGHSPEGIIDLVKQIVFGFLGAGFSFKTFGLPLLWPFGVISAFIGTFIFVTVNNRLNSDRRH